MDNLNKKFQHFISSPCTENLQFLVLEELT